MTIATNLVPGVQIKYLIMNLEESHTRLAMFVRSGETETWAHAGSFTLRNHEAVAFILRHKTEFEDTQAPDFQRLMTAYKLWRDCAREPGCDTPFPYWPGLHLNCSLFRNHAAPHRAELDAIDGYVYLEWPRERT